MIAIEAHLQGMACTDGLLGLALMTRCLCSGTCRCLVAGQQCPERQGCVLIQLNS